MNLLAELLAETQPAANSANPANPRVKISKLAKLATAHVSSAPPCDTSASAEVAAAALPQSAPKAPMDTAKVRARLLALAETEHLDTELVRALPESELTATGEQCADAEREQPGRGRELARQYLHLLATNATMRAGQLPPDFDTPALCRRCGPVWLPREQVECLDVVDGWPRALGCPWCFVHLTQGLRIPRPHVSCAQCQHYRPDTTNPEGVGRCSAQATNGCTLPHQMRTCATFNPEGLTP